MAEECEETYQEYTVRWEIQITATSRKQAAKEALKEMRDRGSSAQVFDVIDEQGDAELIDLYDYQI